MILTFHMPPLEGRGYVISFIAQKDIKKMSCHGEIRLIIRVFPLSL